MISKNEIKRLRQLKTKKFRDKDNLFVAEGEKLVSHFIQSKWVLDQLYCTGNSSLTSHDNAVIVNNATLKSISHLDSPNTVLAVFKKQVLSPLRGSKSVLILDDVRDPGNLGTLIRLADWFGVQKIICSNNTVDLYNPKVVHSTMGSLANVCVVYSHLAQEIIGLKADGYTVVGTLMKGENSNDFVWPEKYALVLGNEANGISQEIMDLLDVNLTIPKSKTASAESLNVAMAGAVLFGQSSQV